MKVVQINSVCGTGSTGRIALGISEISHQHNIDNFIIYGYGKCDYLYSECMQSVIYLKFNILKTRLFGKHGFYSQLATKKLLKRLDEITPDIIHLHNIHGHYINVRMLFEYIVKKDIKVIWTLHDCWAFTGHCSYFDYIGCDKWKTGCYECAQRRNYPDSWFFDRSKECFKDKKELFCSVMDMTIVTPSKWLADLIGESFLNKYPCKIINNGIDLGKFKPQSSELKNKLGLSDKKILLGICFNLYDRKGGKYLIELAKMLGEDEHIVILGLNTDEQLPGNVTVLPKTNSVDELAKIYSMADVFVNPTLEDNFPTVNIESLACGTPVVTFNTGGSPEIIDEKTGSVVDKGNVEVLYEKVKEILCKDREEYRKECRTRAEHMYRDKDRFEEYIELYQK